MNQQLSQKILSRESVLKKWGSNLKIKKIYLFMVYEVETLSTRTGYRTNRLVTPDSTAVLDGLAIGYAIKNGTAYKPISVLLSAIRWLYLLNEISKQSPDKIFKDKV
ncbi:Hypothetical protein CINCED_3A013085 [Cinara cedri]|uniref:Uncharacterized protein n=1 Tax=Cinara cedri TaxID=506608 RepID=A0A5E4LZM0_9HEMI|nr:Hypothetical protein CINCED_3A013085 [Cinara cedri]